MILLYNFESAIFRSIIIQSAVNSLGTTVMAASSAAYNLEVFAYYIMNSFGQACTTFVGQNYGAGKGGRCLKTLKLCLLQSLISTAVVILAVTLFMRPSKRYVVPNKDIEEKSVSGK